MLGLQPRREPELCRQHPGGCILTMRRRARRSIQWLSVIARSPLFLKASSRASSTQYSARNSSHSTCVWGAFSASPGPVPGTRYLGPRQTRLFCHVTGRISGFPLPTTPVCPAASVPSPTRYSLLDQTQRMNGASKSRGGKEIGKTEHSTWNSPRSPENKSLGASSPLGLLVGTAWFCTVSSFFLNSFFRLFSIFLKFFDYSWHSLLY